MKWQSFSMKHVKVCPPLDPIACCGKADTHVVWMEIRAAKVLKMLIWMGIILFYGLVLNIKRSNVDVALKAVGNQIDTAASQKNSHNLNHL